ncbi:hypothetical protein FE394_17860 [Xenorhabdus sp. Reich]|uniref:Uncharacterized protein n=1 Tax=Xenorhabdus littoralis TaxID=2582835 RepID=A0ABU4SQR5_9GAMM|nr:hypothetical protein [Xenorhabdus sp. Reich]
MNENSGKNKDGRNSNGLTHPTQPLISFPTTTIYRLSGSPPGGKRPEHNRGRPYMALRPI